MSLELVPPRRGSRGDLRASHVIVDAPPSVPANSGGTHDFDKDSEEALIRECEIATIASFHGSFPIEGDFRGLPGHLSGSTSTFRA